MNLIRFFLYSLGWGSPGFLSPVFFLLFSLSGLLYSPLSKIRSFALLDLGFSSISKAVGLIAFLLITLPRLFLPQVHIGKSFGQMQGSSAVRNALFTMRSSKEWKVMMHSLPPGFNAFIMPSKDSSKTSNSRFRAIRMA